MLFIMKASKQIFIFLLLFLPGLSSFSQTEPDTGSTVEYESDIKFMVQAMQTLFNLLGDSTITRHDKDEIINRSYLKYFKDDKVQIEDDLDPNRQLPLNKNVQAYLQDIVFFYKNVHFDMEVSEITKGLNDKNEIFYKVSLTRILEGINLYGEPEKLSGDRFMEFNYIPGSEEYKIVSIYTTKLSEKEDIEIWWNELDVYWRTYFSSNIQLNDSLFIADLLTLDIEILLTDTVFVNPLDLMAGDTLIVENRDTLYLSTPQFYSSIKKIFALESIRIQPQDSISNLKPLNKMVDLKEVDFTDCPIDDISPLRSLLKLESLDASGSLVTDLNDLNYLSDIKALRINNTQVNDLSVSKAFGKLETLEANKTLIADLSFLADLNHLRNLKLEEVNLSSYEPISGLTDLLTLDLSGSSFNNLNLISSLPNLQFLHINNTQIKSLDDLSGAENIEFLSIDNTDIASLQPLENIETLKMVYCDETQIDENEVKRFIEIRPGVLIIYETASLLNWWQDINPELKQIILARLDSISDPPNTETLHKIIFTESVDLSGHTEINSLQSFGKLINLRTLNLSETSVSDLSPIGSLTGIRKLDISSTKVSDISPLMGLHSLQDISIENTTIESLKALDLLTSVQLIKADGSSIKRDEVVRFEKINPALVIYQSQHLETWWKGLDKSWRNFLVGKMDLNSQPTGEDLQRLVNLDSLVIPERSAIGTLTPLYEFNRLRFLKIDHLQITDLSPLNDRFSLVSLQIIGGPVNNFSSLTSLYNLESLDLSGTALNDLGFIIELPGLKQLSIQATAIYDLKPLSLLKSLEYIDISYTKVKKLKPLGDLTHLKELKCTNTAISEKNIEKFKKSKPGLKVIYY